MKIYVITTNAKNGGYGTITSGILRLFKKWNWKITNRPEPDVRLCFLYGMVGDVIDRYLNDWKNKKRPYTIFYTVWESSIYPPEWVEKLKSAEIDLILSASDYICNAIHKQGLPAQKWHHGIDERFKFKERLHDGIFTFLHYNSFEFRKGWEIVLQAFTEEFHIEESVKLILKGRELRECRWIIPETITDLTRFKIHPLVEIVTGHLSDTEMVRLSDSADCFVYPSKGEGWGLPPCEMMAVGCPAIIPNAHSFTEYFDKKDCIKVELDGYLNAEPRYKGYLIHCSVTDLRKKMRWAFSNQNTIRSMGKKASKRIHKYYNWNKIGNDLSKIINQSISYKIDKLTAKYNN